MRGSKADLHVLHVLNTLTVGGAELYVTRLANALSDEGIRVTVAASVSDSHCGALLTRGVNLLSLPLQSTRDRRLRHLGNGARVLPRLCSYIREERVDIVHTHLVASGTWAWMAAKLTRAATLHTLMHMYDVPGVLEKCLYHLRIPTVLVDQFHAFSDYAARELRVRYRVPIEKVKVIAPGVDVGAFHPGSSVAARRLFGLPENGAIIGVCARLVPEKRVHLGIEALSVMLRDNPDVALVIAGDGPERTRLESLCKELGVERKVRFLGVVPEVNLLLPAFDLYLQTSKGPNLGFAVLEAMSCGRPVLIAAGSSDERLMAEDTLAGAECGEIAGTQVHDIAAAALRILGDRESRVRAGERARRLAETRYNWDTHVHRLIELYFRLANDHDPGGNEGVHGF